jgi:transposase
VRDPLAELRHRKTLRPTAGRCDERLSRSRRKTAKLAVDIDMLDRHLVEIVETDAALAHRYRPLTSMPGVGLVLACTLLPKLGTMSPKQVAALVGVAPYAFDSKEGVASGAVVRPPVGRSTWQR